MPGNLSIMRGPKPSKPFSRRIPNHKSQEGLKELLACLSSHSKNEKGEMGIISYAQAGSKEATQLLGFAFNVATAKARAQQLSSVMKTFQQNKLQQIEALQDSLIVILRSTTLKGIPKTG